MGGIVSRNSESQQEEEEILEEEQGPNLKWDVIDAANLALQV